MLKFTKRFPIALAAAAFLILPAGHLGTVAAASQSSCVDVALVLAVDVSASVSREEFNLQRKGIASAFRDRGVRDAISSAGRVAVSVVLWGAEGLPKPQSPWIVIDSPQAAERLASMVDTMPRQVTGDTGLGAGLLAALRKIDALDQCATRKIVNVSGDGEETRLYRRARLAPAPNRVRDLAAASDVEINALVISNVEKDLARYFAANVITGPGAFVMDIRDYGDFADALRRKLIREIGPQMVSSRLGSPPEGPVN